MVVETVRVGTAGWALPRDVRGAFPEEGSTLARYAARFNGLEINSTFHRPHRPSTFARWADSVGPAFRFSVKLPRTITHDLRLAGANKPLDAFLESIAPLGDRLGCLLVQLPPSFELDPRVARRFLSGLRKRFDRDIAIEPRHGTWFSAAAGEMLAELRIARVAADPSRCEGGDAPGGFEGMAYYRLHGSPRVYFSSYGEDYLEALAARLGALQRRGIPAWCIFDNTAHGAAAGNALALLDRLRAP